VALYERRDVELPESPVLIVSLEGWIDAGLAAATAWSALSDAIPTELVATFDAEELIDFRARRPHLKIVDGLNTGLTWHNPELRIGVDRHGTGVAFLVGPEPDFRWKAFAASVAQLAVELGCRMMVGFGGFPATVPHTRPIRLAATASDAALAETVGFVSGELEVPAGIEAVLERACSDAGIPAVGLWARVPHYLAASTFPAAALALIEGLQAVAGIEIDTTALQEAADAGRRRVDELIGEAGEHATLIRNLEEQIDEVEGTSLGRLEATGGRLPSADELADELERYLRSNSGGRSDPTPRPDEAEQ
jgi:predicted ATP-grasp superfamily ATP-dependent carboligase